MRQIVILFLLTLCTFTAYGQGTITVNQGSDIDAVVNSKKTTRNKTDKDAPGQQEAKTPAKPSTPSPHKSVEIEHHAASEATATHVTRTKLVKRRVLVKKEPWEDDAMGRKPIGHIRTKGKGFRIQVYSGGNTRKARQEAERVGQKIKVAMPDQPVYVHFYTPRWGCRIGNFTNYKDAQKVLAKVRKLGYKNAVILRGIVAVNKPIYE